jgi:hypothetical protein
MEAPRFLGGRIEDLPEEFHLYVVAAPVVALASMERLMQIRYEVHYVLKGFPAFLDVHRRITQGMTKPFNLTNHALLFRTMPVWLILRLLDLYVHIMP